MDETRDLYDNACVLLALAALFTATDRIAYRKQIEILLTAIDTTLADPAGGWAEDEHGTLPRRQNPHMHLFEACLVLATKTRDASHRRRLDGLYTLFLEQFYIRGAGPLCEFFGPAWERGPKFQSERLDPGHMCEWTWLLHRYSDALDPGTDHRAAETHLPRQGNRRDAGYPRHGRDRGNRRPRGGNVCRALRRNRAGR
ncbi:AGE family epimerase/isomerase [Mesorhizobium sp. M8A.F.Ca.ET.182.01.1.1]|uniref:AGE family epimerase/isomerase n=1 Tax=Mesorhizobium sp. M8A.F.Ca.ET.182.01.1.1 TaxID=2563964 RepID=UPI003FA5DA35